MSGSRRVFLAFLAAGILFTICGLVHASTLGDYRKLDEAGGWNPDVAFDATHGRYLVVWTGAEVIRGRFVNGDGEPVGSVFPIHDGVGGSRFSAVAYSPARSEFLVTWDSYGRPGQSDSIWGQRVHSPDGALVGGNFRIATTGGVRSGVAWGSVSQCYMVVYGLSNVFAQRVSGTGTLLGGEISVSNSGWYPAVSYSPGADAFLVTWDYASPGIGGARYAASTGTRLDSVFPVSPGVADRSTSVHDDVLGLWLVQYQDQSRVSTQSYDQYVRFVNDNGTFGPGPYPSADRPEFEGETNLGCDIAFSAGAGVYLSCFGTNDGIFGQLLNRNGNKLRDRITMGVGDFTFHSNAADSARDRFLTVFSGSPAPGGGWYVYSRLYRVYAPVSGLLTSPGPDRIRLDWTQPADDDMTHAIVRFSTTAPPASPSDGTLVAQIAVTPGTEASCLHTGLSHNQTYYYAVFAHDSTPIYAPGVTVSERPRVPGELDGDGDVDQADFGLFQACLAGSGQSYATGCAPADLDSDGDVDQDDFGVFSACMGGANQLPGC
jgi:hypothetical protein